LFNF
jgi:4-hydroxyphenylpyruvate dioxygenase